MLIGPIIIIYMGFEAVNDSRKVLWALLPICIGLISLYSWIHVKIYFDQLSKARKSVLGQRQPAAVSSARVNPVSITVMAPPFPPYDKNYSIYDNSGSVSTSFQKPEAATARVEYELPPNKALTEGGERAQQEPN